MIANTFRKPQRPYSRRFKITRVIVLALAVITFAGSALLGFAYRTINVPRPQDVATNQFSTIYYNDGTTEMARLGQENRTIVPLSRVPEHVQKAVLSAENRSFYSDPGFSPTGILRAIWLNLTTDETPGGSTITQQYVKKAYLSDTKSLSRKFKELILSIKLEQQYSKDEILGFYLNTIYFGRGAYGIEAASEVYFGKTVDQLTLAEGAVLASSIRSPAGYDPQNHPKAAKARWTYVMDGMLEKGWITKQQRKEAAYPEVLPIGPGKLNQLNGPEGIIVARVKDELASLGYDEDAVYSEGLKVTTTISAAYQSQAVAAVQQQLDGEPDNLVPALVSIDPTTGAVVAYYGNSQGTGFDFAGRGYRQPGSSFKPFVLATALENGYSVYSKRDGSSPQYFPDRTKPVRNSGGSGCSYCSLKTAITHSYNTTFYGLTYDLGAKNVADTAHKLGILPKNVVTGKPTLQEDDGTVSSGIGIGQYEVTVKDMASAFGTFADEGVYNAPYFVQKITDANGKVLYEHKAAGKQVISQDVANDVTFALDDVASYSHDSLDDGRPSASKTGTVQLGDDNNKDAWMVGYTPKQISTAVWIGTQGSDPIKTSSGKIIYGAGIPGKIWQQYMNAVLDGKPVQKLPSKAVIKASKKDSGSSASDDDSGSSNDEGNSEESTPSTASPTNPTTPTTPGTGTTTAPTTPVTPTTPTSPQTSPSEPSTGEPPNTGADAVPGAVGAGG